MVQFVTVDNTNTVQLQYDEKWFHGNWTDTSTQPPSNRSLLSSNFLDAKLVLRFPVVGTGFAYYGMKRSGGGSFQICIDCDPNQPAGPFDTIDALNVTDNGQNPPALLYSKQGLTNDLHTVVLLNTNDTRVHPQGVSQITLDRFEITTQDPAVVTVTGSATSTPTASVSRSSKASPLKQGVIAGVVIFSIVFLALLVGLFLLWRRKRRKSLTTSMEDGHRQKDTSVIEPLVITQSRRPSPTGLRSHPISSSTTLVTLSAKGSRPHILLRDPKPSTSASHSHTGSETSVLAMSQPTAPSTTSSAMPTRLRMEMDAGPVDEDTLPPDYALVFHSQQASEPSAASSSNMSSAESNGRRYDHKIL